MSKCKNCRIKKDSKKKLNEIFKIANNTLWFDDNSDYKTAFFEIMGIIKPEILDNGICVEDLTYIED